MEQPQNTIINQNNVIEQFNFYANKLLNNTVLQVSTKQYRLCEIEMYYYNDNHPDSYTHKDERQLEFNTFYPHKYKNGTYKNGTYKCMDIVFGNKETKTYFGILIRSVKNIDTNEFYTGPCICVNEFLSNFGCTEFKTFFEQHNLEDFKMIDKELDKKEIYIGPRVGLGEKYPEYKNKKYRYAIETNRIKKQKIFEKLI